MSSSEFYVQQARHCFDMATMTRDPAARQRWIDRANEYLMQADALADEAPSQLPLPDTHSQPMQQQQQRAEDTPSDSKEDP